MPAHRRLKPDPALFDRCLAGAELDELAADYGVAPSTLSRFFRSPEGKAGLTEAEQRASAPDAPPVPPIKRTPVARRRNFGPIFGIAGEEVCFAFPIERAPEVLGYRTLDGAKTGLQLMADAGDLVLDSSTPGRLTYPVNTAEGRERLVLVRGCRQRLQVERMCKGRRWDAKHLNPQRTDFMVKTGEVVIGGSDLYLQ